MTTEVITDPETLIALEADWLDLCQRTPGATPFQTPMWLLPWWRAFGSNDLAVIAARGDRGLDALAPLGVGDLTMPATPLKVWNAIQEARKQPF